MIRKQKQVSVFRFEAGETEKSVMFLIRYSVLRLYGQLVRTVRRELRNECATGQLFPALVLSLCHEYKERAEGSYVLFHVQIGHCRVQGRREGTAQW